MDLKKLIAIHALKLAEAKLGIEIKSFQRKSDDAIIDDNDCFIELTNIDKELCVKVNVKNDTASASASVSNLIKVSLKGKEKSSVKIAAKDLKTLKEKSKALTETLFLNHLFCLNLFSKAEKEFRLEIEKFVRKSDNIEIEDDEVLADLIENDKGLWLVALTEDDDFGIINEKPYFLKILL